MSGITFGEAKQTILSEFESYKKQVNNNS
jgi:hypothetical protein